MEIKIKVTDGSSNKIIKNGNRFIAKIKEDRKDGKANRALILLVAEYFDIEHTKVRIVRGKRKPNKVILLEDYENNTTKKG